MRSQSNLHILESRILGYIVRYTEALKGGCGVTEEKTIGLSTCRVDRVSLVRSCPFNIKLLTRPSRLALAQYASDEQRSRNMLRVPAEQRQLKDGEGVDRRRVPLLSLAHVPEVRDSR